MQQYRLITIVLCIGAGLIVLAGAIGLMLLLGEVRYPITATKLALPILCVLIALGIGAAMLGLAALLARGPDEIHPELARTLSRVQAQVADLNARATETQSAVEMISRNQVQQQQSLQQLRAQLLPAGSGLQPSDLEPLYQALHEIRDLAVLPDSERRERAQRERTERRAAMIKQSFELVAARQWPQAERLVIQMESQFPNDDEVAKTRHYLKHARRLNEQEAVGRVTKEVDDLIAAAAWDQALAKARSIVDGFPESAEARELVDRVVRERKHFEETTVQRMFDELRHDIDRRMWRALLHAERLLERYPDHARADEVRFQLATIQENAEIEERQELEVRIQELIKAHRFDEAIGLAQELMRRYPLSPQAESLETLLPRIRALVEEQRQRQKQPQQPVQPQQPPQPSQPPPLPQQSVAAFAGLHPELADDELGLSERPI